MTHTYFTNLALAFMEKAGAPRADVTQMAAWAEAINKEARNARACGVAGHEISALEARGLIVDIDGNIVAHTGRSFANSDLNRYELDCASAVALGFTVGSSARRIAIHPSTLGAIRRQIGKPVAHVKYWEIGTGPARKPRRSHNG